jgi:hypothetical protein
MASDVQMARFLTETTFREVVSLFTLPNWLPLPSKRRKRWALQPTFRDRV